jgi:hypothetical protein
MVKLRSQFRVPLVRPPPLPTGLSDDIELRLSVHDSSRIEWVASVALPAPRQPERKYTVQFTLEIPTHLYSTHDVWDHKQNFTRLQSPSEEEGPLRVDRADVDELRRDTLGAAHRLKTLRDQLERNCSGAAAQLTLALHPSLESHLTDALLQGVALVAEMRRLLDQPPSEHPGANHLPEVTREWGLADEFLSHQLLDFLGAAQRAIDEVLLGPKSRLRELDVGWADELRCLVGESLSEELVHRSARGYVNPCADQPLQLSRFVERGSRLKKHFQDVLFLDVESYMVDYKLRNWTGVAAASIAAAFWLAFTLLPIGPGARAGISLGTFGVLFAVSYALKDRIKELTRGWLAGRLVRLYGQRAVTLRLPARLDAQRKVLVEARETFDCVASTGEDQLNRHVGKNQRVILLTFRMKTEVSSSVKLERAGIHSIKHVFRYDLSPIFSRLDNSVKPVPILDPTTRRVRFVEAPKVYRMPMKLVATVENGPTTRAEGMLVLSKRGVERIEDSTD